MKGAWDPVAGRPWLLTALGIVVADQFTKWIVVQRFALFETLTLLPVLDLTRLHNTGAAFSLFADQAGWQRWFFTLVALGVAVVLVVVLLRLAQGYDRWLAACLALVLGGALGNVIDRIRFGYVIDFVHLHWDRWYWPAFNVADSAISIGAVLLLLDAFRRPKKG